MIVPLLRLRQNWLIKLVLSLSAPIMAQMQVVLTSRLGTILSEALYMQDLSHLDTIVVITVANLKEMWLILSMDKRVDTVSSCKMPLTNQIVLSIRISRLTSATIMEHLCIQMAKEVL